MYVKHDVCVKLERVCESVCFFINQAGCVEVPQRGQQAEKR